MDQNSFKCHVASGSTREQQPFRVTQNQFQILLNNQEESIINKERFNLHFRYDTEGKRKTKFIF